MNGENVYEKIIYKAIEKGCYLKDKGITNISVELKERNKDNIVGISGNLVILKYEIKGVEKLESFSLESLLLSRDFLLSIMKIFWYDERNYKKHTYGKERRLGNISGLKSSYFEDDIESGIRDLSNEMTKAIVSEKSPLRKINIKKILTQDDVVRLFLGEDILKNNYLCFCIESEAKEYSAIPLDKSNINSLLKGDKNIESFFRETSIWYTGEYFCDTLNLKNSIHHLMERNIPKGLNIEEKDIVNIDKKYRKFQEKVNPLEKTIQCLLAYIESGSKDYYLYDNFSGKYNK